VFLQPGQADPVIGVAMGDVYAGDVPAGPAHPLGQGVDLLERDQRVDQDRLLS
jgi:hypothetical protein